MKKNIVISTDLNRPHFFVRLWHAGTEQKFSKLAKLQQEFTQSEKLSSQNHQNSRDSCWDKWE